MDVLAATFVILTFLNCDFSTRFWNFDSIYVSDLVVLILTLISIYILSDLGDLSNLIGSLSSEWIMCELGVFPIFFLRTIF